MKRTYISVAALLLAAQLGGGCASTTATTASSTAAAGTAPGETRSEQRPAPAPAGTLSAAPSEVLAANPAAGFQVVSEQFADLRVLRYQVPGFETLEPQQKELLYYLYEAALCGREISYDQNFKHNLRVRRTLEAIWPANQQQIAGTTNTQRVDEANKLNIYTKRVWFSNGVHHHYSTRKFVPECSPAYFAQLVKSVEPGSLPLEKGETVDQFLATITPIIFDPNVSAKRVNQEAGQDLLTTSANNFYEGVTQKEAEDFYAKKIDKKDPRPISYGLNSKLMKGADGQLVERTWKVGGMYGEALTQVVYWLGKAVDVAETPEQKLALQRLVQYYTTGDLKTWDDYNTAWVRDTKSRTDVVNGFIEVYGDPLGYRASYESVVSFKDLEATKRIKAIGDQAQWFEDNSPILPKHKKKNVVGITAKVITTVVESGDAAPATPIGINLPNATWIRKEHGSKSVNLGNIVDAYSLADAGGSLDEFAYSDEEKARARKYAGLAGKLHTDMHEVIGHASGQINPGVGTPKETLKSYASAIEEGRADLVALYYLMDPKLVQLGVVPSLEVGKAEYDNYIRNGLMGQLVRLPLGETVEEAHMRNRQMVAKWAYEKGKKANVIEKVTKNGKTYFKVNDYQKLRGLFGQLLRELQRLTSEGDYAAAKNLIETYGVKVDPALHKEVLERYAKLNIAPYAGFIQPKLVPVEQGGKIVDVKLEYPSDFAQQMLEYSRKYKFLPNYN
ncbi:dipeptidyl-peptidase 3 family protein [Hymenobacter chitinivorans]|uniref:Dipeptidyl-peptidase-3 n=1 Tax=Hymenobacter chitinivorans DSM 11115 TaxID=1121954 RepID=A0A2M9BTE4_9BACT|nr:dihydrofolate reductase [Hymenobacter chitinivorans]PJJ61214.1 dipeptidyl-peptidase-3 [Hymenobacter chitinivorans DSM 11115]